MDFFIENQKGLPDWNWSDPIAKEYRTEALDLPRRVIREKQVPLPRHDQMVELFATHVAAVAKKHEEDDESRDQKYTYVRSGPDHFSLAFTYNVLTWEMESWRAGIIIGDDDPPGYRGGRPLVRDLASLPHFSW